MTGEYTGLYILLGGIGLTAVIVTTLDWISQRRQDRQRREQHR